MPIKHNKTNTCGVISTLKGGWDTFPDQMESDLKHSNTSSLNQPSCFTNWNKRTAHLIKADHPNVGHPSVCGGKADHPHIRMIW